MNCTTTKKIYTLTHTVSYSACKFRALNLPHARIHMGVCRRAIQTNKQTKAGSTVYSDL